MKNLYILCIIILLTQCSLHKTKELSIRVQVNEIDSVSKKITPTIIVIFIQQILSCQIIQIQR